MGLFRRIAEGETVGILRYHAIVNPDDNYYASPGISITPKEFDDQIRFLSKHFSVISLDTVAKCIARRQSFPARSIVLTFDDGYRDNYLAYKILKKYNGSGTFYIVTEAIGNQSPLWLFEVIYRLRKTSRQALDITLPDTHLHFSFRSHADRAEAAREVTEVIKSNTLEVRNSIMAQVIDQLDDIPQFAEKVSSVMLDWEQVCEMAANGMTIGGHTMTHLNLPNADFKDALREIGGCKKTIERAIGSEVRHFSYPNGGNYAYYNDAVKKAVKEAGYTTSTTSNNGVVGLRSDRWELERVRVTSNISEIVYQLNCEPLITIIRGYA